MSDTKVQSDGRWLGPKVDPENFILFIAWLKVPYVLIRRWKMIMGSWSTSHKNLCAL